MTQTKTEISIKKWARKGGMLVNTDFLEWDDPMHPYNQAKAQGVEPEDFGIENPRAAEFDSWSRDRLIDEVLGLRKELDSLYRAGF